MFELPEETFEDLTDTQRKRVAEAVRRIKDEYKITRDMIRDDLKQVLDEHEKQRRSWWKRVLAWVASQL